MHAGQEARALSLDQCCTAAHVPPTIPHDTYALQCHHRTPPRPSLQHTGREPPKRGPRRRKGARRDAVVTPLSSSALQLGTSSESRK